MPRLPSRSLRAALLSVACGMTAGCGIRYVAVGPDKTDVEPIASQHCPIPEIELPTLLDRNVRGLLLSGRKPDMLLSFLFGNPGYDFVEQEFSTDGPDGLRLVRYTNAGPSTIVAGNQVCPPNTIDIGLYPFGEKPWRNACVAVEAIRASSARWLLRRTISERDESDHRLQFTIDEVVDRRSNDVVGHARRVEVTLRRSSVGAVMLGPLPLATGRFQASADCGRSLNAEDIKRVLSPPQKSTGG